jgi:integrase/recombinase XerC
MTQSKKTTQTKSYSEKSKQEYILKIRELLNELPPFCGDYFRGVEMRTSERTRLGYAYDLKGFFQFLIENIDEFQEVPTINKFSLTYLNKLQAVHIEKYLEYTSFYVRLNNNKEYKNGEKAKSRKLSAVRSLLKYLFKNRMVNGNVASLVDAPKIHEKPIIRLETNEVADLLDEVEVGENLTKGQQRFHDVTSKRDVAMISLLLGTGIRVSECVGIDIKDIDFNNNSVKVTRKGGNETILYFSDEVRTSLLSYLQERNLVECISGHENAMFLSIQRRRITVRAVENLVKKYSKIISPLKNISPHKLRSTFGTNLYRETGDIYLVADMLGHRDVNTTRKHYASIADEQRRMAARVIKLRED